MRSTQSTFILSRLDMTTTRARHNYILYEYIIIMYVCICIFVFHDDAYLPTSQPVDKIDFDYYTLYTYSVLFIHIRRRSVTVDKLITNKRFWTV
jgi:hypothetical protein